MSLLALLGIAAAAHVVTPPSPLSPGPLGKDKCANATSHQAGDPAALKGDPAKPRKLTELPNAQSYAAVYRLVDGCAVPVLYRDVREVRPPRP
ncbi:hypothetical protein [Sphingomonas daechungensis]|uniref:hypothetical protein n=1 Tax=Sphingomonas daechungensis TaxID=1176646 RepID=UPI003784C3B0